MTAVRPILLVACGAATIIAIEAQLYACAVVLALGAVWGVLLAAWPPAPLASPPPEPPTDDSAAAQARLRLLESLLDHTPAPLVIRDPRGAIRAGNRAARRLFGVEDLMTTPPLELAAALRMGEPAQRLTLHLGAEGASRAYAVALTDLLEPRGAMRLAALVDIQPEIRVAEAAALRDLMQVLSHEIMNALTPVASLAATARDILSDEQSAGAIEARDAVGAVARRAEGLARFVEAYRSLARLPAPILSKVSVSSMFDEVAHVFRARWAGKGGQLRVLKPDPDIVTELDLDLMVHALANILSNGAEAVLGAGMGSPNLRLIGEARDGGTRLTVQDNGPGIDLPDPDLVFRPFFTTKPDGSGVGLSFAQQIVLGHGGDLTLMPYQPGCGAAFVVTI